MKNIKVLGSGCANCKRTLALIEETARSHGVEVELEKVEDIGHHGLRCYVHTRCRN